ncbi:hypothetical protein [Microvirga roseola]|uniref:hypothetical protein n=1 Tax=Microvirga roseola TaxID=2883126 RepID=UPI001E4C02C4|nr:hypothetical protein [Microvirga roseola]
MSLIVRGVGAFLLATALVPGIARAEDPFEIWTLDISQSWLDDHLAATRRKKPVRSAYRLSRTEIWASGIAPSDVSPFEAAAFDRTIGAKLQPFRDLNFAIGTELSRNGGDIPTLSSRASWEAFWSRDWESMGGVHVGFSTGGSLSRIETGYSQHVSGTLGIPLDVALNAWRTELRLSPSMNLDMASGRIGSGLASEIIGETVLSAPADRFKSVLNLKIGYQVAPHTRPVASARVELRIAPNL